MKLSRTSGYAIHVMLQLAEMKPGIPVTCCHLATAGGMPERYLLEVLRGLVARGLLQSTRGSEGGFALARLPDEITPCDVFAVFDTPRSPFVPPIAGQLAKVHTKLMHSLHLAYNAARAELKRVTVGDLLRDSASNGAPYNGSYGLPLQTPIFETPQNVVDA